MNTYTVYKHTSPSGKVYIGITARDVMRRWRGGSAYRNNAHFYAAIQKYGWSSFAHEILAEGLTYEEACRLEVALIRKHRATDPSHGYNRSLGGDKTTLGYKFSDESRRKISRATKGRRKGVPHTEEHTRRISQALNGHPVSDATREKLRRALGDRFQNAEARKRQKENTPKGSSHHRAMPIMCITTREIFPTIEAAAQAKGIHRANISAVCRGKQKTAGGYQWEYVKEGTV